MSSAEPPSRIPPRNQTPDTKAARDEFSSKGKVEKVREVDADETKKKFQSFLKEEPKEEEDIKQSPFDLYANKPPVNSGKDLGDVDDAIVASPSYSPPPDVKNYPTQEEDASDDEVTTNALPQSSDFWESSDLPPDIKKFPSPMKEVGKKGPPPKENSPFGAPGKPVEPMKKEASQEKPLGHKLPSPFEGPLETSTTKKGVKKSHGEKTKEEFIEGQVQLPREEREGGRGGEKMREQKTLISELSQFPPFPSPVQGTAMQATQQVLSYLNPATVPLFYQMVGTMYIMTSPRGITQTEFLLNNPTYSNSKFFGATITIEKYATAPDSFNIRLTGTDQAVSAFRENIPSLMSAFQNGDFRFKVNRIDVEYTVEKPVYRRKEGKKDAGDGDLGERRR